MVKDDHVYTLNHDIKSLCQHQDRKNPIVVKASSNYYINENKTPVQYKMIETVDDVVKIISEVKEKAQHKEIKVKGPKLGDLLSGKVKLSEKENVIINLILKGDDLTKFLYELKEQVGYEPQIKYQAGKLTLISLKLGKTIIIIKTQQLLPESIDGQCNVSSEEVYNNTNKAMVEFNHALFKKNHKSFYSHQDIVILDECRTIVPSGITTKGVDDLIEVDVSKAFTSALSTIKEIPVFNEFDNFKSYQNQLIKNLSLYMVLVNKPNLFFNKKYCLVYGQFLREFVNDVKILYYKDPSFIRKVKYSDIVDNLYNTQISDNEHEDKYCKKTNC
jgi:hypothetical protein